MGSVALIHETKDCSILTYILINYNQKRLLNFVIQRTYVEPLKRLRRTQVNNHWSSITGALACI